MLCRYYIVICKKVELIRLKNDIDKLDIDKSKTVPNRFNNIKADVFRLDITKLETIPINLKILSDAIDNQVGKKQCMIS